MEFNLADLFEAAVDAYPDREYLVAERQTPHLCRDGGAGQPAGPPPRRPGNRAGRPRRHLRVQLASSGSRRRGPSSSSGPCGSTSTTATSRTSCATSSPTPTSRHWSTSASSRRWWPRCCRSCRQLRHVIVIEDGQRGAGSLAATPSTTKRRWPGQSAERDFGPRSGDDLYILYTGGTTGMPKGVVWRHEDVFFALGGGIDALTERAGHDRPKMVEKGAAAEAMTHLPDAPLMHGATQWGVMGQSFVGNRDRPRGQVRSARGLAAGRAREGEHDHDHR